jgi:hypothetical protein
LTNNNEIVPFELIEELIEPIRTLNEKAGFTYKFVGARSAISAN